MAGLAIASLVQSGYDLHWIARGQGLEVGLVLLAVPFFLQFLASVLSYLARDGTTGTPVGVLSASWLAIALIHIVRCGGNPVPARRRLRVGCISILLRGSRDRRSCRSRACRILRGGVRPRGDRAPLDPPYLPSGTGRAALTGAPTAALDDVVHEPGVRQMT